MYNTNAANGARVTTASRRQLPFREKSVVASHRAGDKEVSFAKDTMGVPARTNVNGATTTTTRGNKNSTKKDTAANNNNNNNNNTKVVAINSICSCISKSLCAYSWHHYTTDLFLKESLYAYLWHHHYYPASRVTKSRIFGQFRSIKLIVQRFVTFSWFVIILQSGRFKIARAFKIYPPHIYVISLSHDSRHIYCS